MEGRRREEQQGEPRADPPESHAGSLRRVRRPGNDGGVAGHAGQDGKGFRLFHIIWLNFLNASTLWIVGIGTR